MTPEKEPPRKHAWTSMIYSEPADDAQEQGRSRIGRPSTLTFVTEGGNDLRSVPEEELDVLLSPLQERQREILLKAIRDTPVEQLSKEYDTEPQNIRSTLRLAIRRIEDPYNPNAPRRIPRLRLGDGVFSG